MSTFPIAKELLYPTSSLQIVGWRTLKNGEEKSMKNLFTWEIPLDFATIITQLSPAERDVLRRSIARLMRPKKHGKEEERKEDVAQQQNNFT